MTTIHLTSDDLARTRVDPTFGPYAEAMFSLGVIADQRNGILFGGWRQQLGTLKADAVEPLRRLIGGSPPRLDLFTLIGKVGTEAESRDALLSIDGRDLRDEIHAAARCPTAFDGNGISTIPAWALDAATDRAARSTLVDQIDAYSGRAIRPHWDALRSYLTLEAAVRARDMARGGVEHLLNNSHPAMRWHGGVVEIDQNDGRGVHIQLQGRGLVLVPSVFCRRITVYISLTDGERSAVLFYPALRDMTDAYRLWAGLHPRSPKRALVALLGPTRAAALDAIGYGCTTSELADRLGVSPPTASYHVAVLREAKLICTRRLGSTTLHTITQLGTALLNGVPPASGSPRSGSVSS
jgi:DNA-binding transcriptional ArsR family regulator